jgi:hypothetical protein
LVLKRESGKNGGEGWRVSRREKKIKENKRKEESKATMQAVCTGFDDNLVFYLVDLCKAT